VAIFKRREKRNLAKWLNYLDSLGSAESASGVAVNEDSAMTAASVVACLRVLSTTMAMLPLPVYRRLQTGGKERAYDHPLYTILHDSPNNYQTAYEFRQQMMMHLLLYGNHYSLMDFDPQIGIIRGLIPFPEPARMEVALFGTEPRYQYTRQDGSKLVFTQNEVLHFRGMSSNGLMGVNLMDTGRDQIGLALALQAFAGRFFKNGANIGGVLEHPGTLSADAQNRLRAGWEKAYSGVTNAHKVAILEEGMKYTRMGATPEEAQALESRKFQTLEVARIFGVPPHMIGDLERATFSNIEHQGIEFVTYCLSPWCKLIEQRIWKQLLNDVEKQSMFAEFNVSALMRGDYKSRQEGLAIQRQNGIINADEWRELESFNPIGGTDGTTYMVIGNMMPVGQKKDEPPKADPEDDKDEKDDKEDPKDRAFNILLADAVTRICKREATDLQRKDFDIVRHEEYVRTVMEPIYKAFAMDGLDDFVRSHCDAIMAGRSNRGT
jgi:HK97 family phage portal protein